MSLSKDVEERGEKAEGESEIIVMVEGGEEKMDTQETPTKLDCLVRKRTQKMNEEI